MSEVDFHADYLGDINTYLKIVKEDYTKSLPFIEILRVEKEKIFFRADVNESNPKWKETVDEFREDIAAFLDKYIDDGTVTASMMFVEMHMVNIPVFDQPEKPVPTSAEDMQNTKYKLVSMMDELTKHQPTVTHYDDWFNVILRNGEEAQVQIRVTRDKKEFK